MQVHHVASLYRMEGDHVLSRWGTAHYHIFVLAAKGSFTYQIGGEQVPLMERDALFIRQGSMRSCRTVAAPGPHHLFIVYFSDVPQEDLAGLLERPHSHFPAVRQYHYLLQRFSVLQEYWLGRPAGWSQAVRGIVFEMVGMMHREMSEHAQPPAQRKLAQQIRQYIVQHYREPIKLEDLSKLVNRSPAYVSAAFKHATGKSPLEYMHEVRVSAARDLILNTEMSIEEISEYLGYCNQSYFGQKYKKIVGCPPTHTATFPREHT